MSDGYYSSFNVPTTLFSGLPRPLTSYTRGAIIPTTWGGQTQSQSILVDYSGNLCSIGNIDGTAMKVVAGEATICYLTADV